MTKGLAFLSKKRFHPGRRDNMEKVWLAEQKEKNEKEMIEQLRRERKEQDEILRLREALDNKGESEKERRPQWMTMTADIGGGKSVEDFLKGDKLIEDPAAELKKAKNGALFAQSEINPYQDAMSKVREDPLLMIKQKEQEKLKNTMSNPFAMRKLAEDEVKVVQKKLEKAKKKGNKKKVKKYKKQLAHLIGITSEKDIRALRDKIKDELKGSSKGERKHRHKHESKNQDKESLSRSRSPSRSRSVSHSRSPSRSPSRSRSVSKSVSPSPTRNYSNKHDSKYSRRRSRSRSPSRSHSPRRSHASSKHSRSKSRSRSRSRSHRHSRKESRSRSRSRSHRHSRKESRSKSRSRSRSHRHSRKESRDKKRSPEIVKSSCGLRQLGTGSGVKRNVEAPNQLEGLLKPQSIIAPKTNTIETLRRLKNLNNKSIQEKSQEIDKMKDDAKNLMEERIERIKANHEKESQETLATLSKPFATSSVVSQQSNSIDFSTMTLAGRLQSRRNNLQKDLDD